MQNSIRVAPVRRSKWRRRLPIYIFAAVAALIVIGFVTLLLTRFPQRAVYPLKYKEEIQLSCDEYGLDPFLVASVINTESGFNPDARSSAGAIGLMQLLPSTAEWAASMRGMSYNEELLTEPQYNIDLGCWLLNYLLNRYNGSVRYALIAYNAGAGTLDGWLKDSELLDGSGRLTAIPYGETEAYVKKVEAGMTRYREIYGEQFDD